MDFDLPCSCMRNTRSKRTENKRSHGASGSNGMEDESSSMAKSKETKRRMALQT